MRRRLQIYVLMTLVAVLWTINANARNYGVSIGGKEISSDNYSNITSEGGFTALKEGKITYDPENRILTLDNARIEVADKNNNGIVNTAVVDMTIVVKGNCQITVTEWTPITVYKPTVIDGQRSGVLTCVSNSDCGIFLNETSLVIRDCDVSAKGKWGISGVNGNLGEELTIVNSSVVAQSLSGNATMEGLASLTLMNCIIYSPKNASYDSKLKGVALNGVLVTEEIVIKPVEVEKYALMIGDQYVTSANCMQISAANGFPVVTDGMLTYDAENKVLTLDNVTLDVTDDKSNGILNEGIDGLTIVLKGENQINVQEWSPIAIYKSTVIDGKGSGKLTCVSSSDCGIFITSSTLTVRDCELNASGNWGISGIDGRKGEHLAVVNADVRAKGSSGNGSIESLSSLMLTDCEIVKPAGAAYDSNLKGVALNGVLVTEEVIISPIVIKQFELMIGDQYVNSANCMDISAANGFPVVTDGMLTYDAENKVLTLDNVILDVADDKSNGILNEGIDGLTIVLKGENQINVQEWSPIAIYKSTVIDGKGSGKLTCVSSSDCGIFITSSTLTVRDCELNASGNWGISGIDGRKGEHLAVVNADVRAKGSSGNGSIESLSSLMLTDCEIVKPAGAAYDSNLKGVALNGVLVTEEVVIERGVMSIGHHVLEDGAAVGSIYNIDGRKIEKMQRGVNIVKMNDGKTRKVVF